MKINFPILDEEITITNVTFLALEDQQVFSDLVKQFYQYNGDSDLKIFDSRLTSLKESELLVITDILGYNLNSTSMLKLIHADLEKQSFDF